MGKKKKKQAAAARAGTATAPCHAKKRHQKKARYNDRWATPGPLPPGVVARIPAPVITSKHRTYLEFVENKDKKKKLEFEVTTAREPPPGFEFVPVGNPDLTKACKELSREQDAMIFIVSDSKEVDANRLGIHMNRVGHHIRRKIVEEARKLLGQPTEYFLETVNGRPEPIPESQEEINAQADAVIRDLFPRMPNTDRQMIIDHSFRKGISNRTTVGLAADLTLSRRVQLAVLAHIRHTHTRYDQLIREVGWSNARKAVESVCLDFLVKWRGDEETGRDQLDEILREIIVISDSEDSETEDDESSDDSDGESSGESQSETASRGSVTGDDPSPNGHPGPELPEHGAIASYAAPPPQEAHPRRAVHRRLSSRNFQRYEAAAQSRWQQAQERVRHGPHHDLASLRPVPAPQDGTQSQMDVSYSRQGPRQAYNVYGPPSVPGDHHNRSGGQGGQEVLPRQSMPPVAIPASVPTYPGAYQQPPPPHTDIPVTNGHRNPVDFGPPQSAVERLELKDLLVPSIEPMSPQADNPSTPIFVRPLPPRSQQLPRQPPPAGQSLKRRSRSPPSQRVPHHSAVPYIARDREPLSSRSLVIEEGRLERSGIAYRWGVPSYDSHGPEQYGQPKVYQSSSSPRQLPWHAQRPRPTDGHVLEYARTPPSHDRPPTIGTGPRAVVPEHLDGRIPRTERNPIIVEDWGRDSERVIVVPSRPLQQQQQPPRSRPDEAVIMQDVSHLPVAAFDHNLHHSTHGRRALAREAHYEPRTPREYVPAPGPTVQRYPAAALARDPSPLYYERVEPLEQPRYPPPDNGYVGRFDNGFTAINVDRDSRALAVPSQQPVLREPSYYMHHHSPYPRDEFGLQSAPSTHRAHKPQREYIELD